MDIFFFIIFYFLYNSIYILQFDLNIQFNIDIYLFYKYFSWQNIVHIQSLLEQVAVWWIWTGATDSYVFNLSTIQFQFQAHPWQKTITATILCFNL